MRKNSGIQYIGNGYLVKRNSQIAFFCCNLYPKSHIRMPFVYDTIINMHTRNCGVIEERISRYVIYVIIRSCYNHSCLAHLHFQYLQLDCVFNSLPRLTTKSSMYSIIDALWHHRWPVVYRHKWTVMMHVFPCHDVMIPFILALILKLHCRKS